MKFVDNKSALNPPVVYATDSSKAVVPMLFLFFMALWLYYGAIHVKSCLALCSRDFFNPFSIVITLVGEERAGLCTSRAFVCLFYTRYFCPFSLSLDVGGWLRLVILALPGLFK